MTDAETSAPTTVRAAKINLSRVAAIGLASLLVLLVGGLLYVRHLVGIAEREAAASQQQLVAEQATTDAARKRLARFEKLAEQAKARKAQPPGARALVSMAAHYRENPAVTRTYFRPMIRRHFAELFAPGVLTGAQQEEFEEMLLRLGPRLDMMGQIGLGWDEPGQDALVKNALGAEVIVDVYDKFGAEVATRYIETIRTRDVHLAVDNLAVKLLQAGEPLDRTASAQLTSLLLEAGSAVAPEHRLKLAALDWDLVMQRAPAVLSATQLRALQAIKARALFDGEYERVSGYTASPQLPQPER